METVGQYILKFFKWISCVFIRLWGALVAVSDWKAFTETGNALCHGDSGEWTTNEILRTHHHGDEASVMVQTSTHAFMVDLQRLAACSEYFRALSQSRMRETSENLIHLEHVPSSVFHNLLEFTFYNKFEVLPEELASHIQVSSYLVAESFLSKCLSVLSEELSPENCGSYLSLLRETFCSELKITVFTYLSRNMLELPHLIRCLSDEEQEEVVHLREHGVSHICSLRKENLTTWTDPETVQARHLFVLEGSEETGVWSPLTEFPFTADKWCFTTVVLYNYLYMIGGHRQRVKRGWEFKMAAFRYNPFTNTWVTTARLLKRRRHFSAVACGGCIFAVGGWYLDSLVTPDSCTSLYTAVERYDPWKDTWRFVSPLPLTDFQFTMSLSYDIPLTASSAQDLYVLGNIQRTGEKLLLQYNPRQDSWCELLPTLTRADADMPTLYFLGASEKLFVIGGNNSDNVVTSFCLRSQKWGQVLQTDKVALAGQGTMAGDYVLIPSIEHNTIVKMDLKTLSLQVLPSLPISMNYESVFQLFF